MNSPITGQVFNFTKTDKKILISMVKLRQDFLFFLSSPLVYNNTVHMYKNNSTFYVAKNVSAMRHQKTIKEICQIYKEYKIQIPQQFH